MSVDKLIEGLRTESLYKDKATLEIMDLCMEAADALSTLKIDAVHVTRCENCRFADWAAWARKYTCGKIQGLLVSGDHYCAFGKGRE